MYYTGCPKITSKNSENNSTHSSLIFCLVQPINAFYVFCLFGRLRNVAVKPSGAIQVRKLNRRKPGITKSYRGGSP